MEIPDINKANDWFSRNCDNCKFANNCQYEELVEQYLETLKEDRRLEIIGFKRNFDFSCFIKEEK